MPTTFSPTCIVTIAELRSYLATARARGRTIGFVPTMGALHEGHLSLMRKARSENDCVVVSIFVNPLQFAPDEDLQEYPCDLSRDLNACSSVNADIVFAPTPEEMYPKPLDTKVKAGKLTKTLCGASRPTHFDGVATVLVKLFSIVGECSAYFGRKDFQQLVMTQRLVDDLSLPVRIVGCPIVREVDGLAMSSRNVYLNTTERSQAPMLRQALEAAISRIRAGEKDPAAVRAVMRETLTKASSAEIDYAEVVSAVDLSIPKPLNGEIRLLVAVRFGETRLIDNAGCVIPDKP